jgi:hypothetical protein
VDEPDHLLVAPVNGDNRLVGVAYAFRDAVSAAKPATFESDLAHWHDHPELGGPGQTLHMLHLWFVPSSNGPFAGLNFWLPFLDAGIATPSACWMANEADASRIQQVSFSLAASAGIGSLREALPLARAALEALAGGPAAPNTQTPATRAPEGAQTERGQTVDRAEFLTALDQAARIQNHDAWMLAADQYLASLSTREKTVVDRLLRNLTEAQRASPERQ